MIHVKVWIDGKEMLDTVSSQWLLLLDKAGIKYEIIDDIKIIY